MAINAGRPVRKANGAFATVVADTTIPQRKDIVFHWLIAGGCALVHQIELIRQPGIYYINCLVGNYCVRVVYYANVK